MSLRLDDLNFNFFCRVGDLVVLTIPVALSLFHEHENQRISSLDLNDGSDALHNSCGNILVTLWARLGRCPIMARHRNIIFALF